MTDDPIRERVAAAKFELHDQGADAVDFRFSLFMDGEVYALLNVGIISSDLRAERQFAERIVSALNAACGYEEMRRALEPFAEFASNVDENGWISTIHREPISTWFGPSDFRSARAALSRTQGERA